jgi:hypothetical protein
MAGMQRDDEAREQEWRKQNPDLSALVDARSPAKGRDEIESRGEAPAGWLADAPAGPRRTA